jgi:outer membrane receptor protein involved in Fe transport
VQGTITYRDSAPVDLRQDMDGSGTNPNDFLGRLGSATLVDLFAGFDWSRYSAELFVSNLFDERDEVARFVACSVCTQTRVLPGRPRTFGIRLGAHF